nr:ATP-grasp fold amidoligase family protein [Mycobacterium sp. Root265]
MARTGISSVSTFYAVDGAVWFGEYTPYPGGGLLRYTPKQFDAEQGAHWKLLTQEQVQRGRP